jgi:mannosyltransferase OCH1-like enzyme
MYSIYSKNRSNISNLLLKSNYEESNTIFEFNIQYMDEYSFNLNINLIDGNECKIYIINKYNENEQITLDIKNNFFFNTIHCFFKLIKDDQLLLFNIPKIIHQSYKSTIKKNMYNAVSSWKNMNMNYEYKYWNDEDCYDFLVQHFDENVLDAYNSLYAGAYKSDIFRLCVLYIYGGIWTDISSTCLYPIDKIITDEKLNLLIVKDNPSQISNGNIYQAFIIVDTKNEIIKAILDFTIDIVLNHEYYYQNEFSYLLNEPIAVTGPTIFAIGLNKFLDRINNQIFNDNTIDLYKNNKNYFIKIIDHYPGEIKINDVIIIKTKYDNWNNDRINTHYSSLYHDGYIYKKKIKDIYIDSEKPTIYQIWIQDEFVSNNMYGSIQTIIKNHSCLNYTLLTNKKILLLLEKEDEFPLLISAYNKVKPFAFKSDLIRYYILYKYGGIYIDADFISINRIEELYYNYDFVFAKDLNKNSMYNAFIICKKGNSFMKLVLEKAIDNIFYKSSYISDLHVTGPGLLGECFSSYFNINKPFREGKYNTDGQNILILNHCFDLPIPKGNWIDSSRNYYVNKNILYTECKSFSGEWINNEIYFSPGDHLTNINGYINNNTYITEQSCIHSTILYDEEKIYFFTKYPNFNNEKIMLNGNDFAEMYINNNIFN